MTPPRGPRSLLRKALARAGGAIAVLVAALAFAAAFAAYRTDARLTLAVLAGLGGFFVVWLLGWVARAGSAIATLDADDRSLVSHVEASMSALSAADENLVGRIGRVESSLGALTAADQGLVGRLAQLETSVAALAAVDQTLSSRFGQVEGSLASLADADQSFVARFGRVEGSVAALASADESLAGRFGQMEASLASLAAADQDLADRFGRAEATIAAIGEGSRDLAGRLGQTEAAMTALGGETQELRSRLGQVAASVASLAAAGDEFSGRLGQVEGSAASLAAVGQDLSGRLGQVEGSVTSLAAGSQDLFGRLGQAEARTATLGQGAQDLLGRVKQAEATLAALSEGDQALAGRIRQVEATVAALSATGGELAGRLGQAERTLSLLSSVEKELVSLKFPVERLGLAAEQIFRSRGLDSFFLRLAEFDPEIEVLPLLASVLKNRRAIDVGANRGEFSEALRRAGFSVEAFEPNPALIEGLRERFAADEGVRLHPVACGDRDGDDRLQIARVQGVDADATLFSTLRPHPSFAGIVFETEVEVQVRRLDTVLAAEGPVAVGLLKTDTEGHDLAVLAGAAQIEAEALLVEFWDEEHVFNQQAVRNRLQDYLGTLDLGRFAGWVVMWRGSHRDAYGLSFGARTSPRGSWGNVLFYRDEEVGRSVESWALSTFGTRRVQRSAAPGTDARRTA